MQRRDNTLLLKILASLLSFAIFVSHCNGGEISESESFFNFIRAVDPKNVLSIERSWPLPHPCSHQRIGVRCTRRFSSITEIRLENFNLGGILDAESVCKLPNLRVLILAKNQIQGTVPDSIANCTSLIHLDISSNDLSGNLPLALTKLKNLRRLDISKNRFSGIAPSLKRESKFARKHSLESDASRANKSRDAAVGTQYALAPSSKFLPRGRQNSENNIRHANCCTWILLAVGVTLFLLLLLFLNTKAVQAAKHRKILRALAQTAKKTPPSKVVEEVNGEERRSELVLFVEEQERFGFEDLIAAAADLLNQGLCSSLYKVQLKNNAIFAVKRFTKLHVSFEEFGRTMRKIGNLKHQNILPLIGYHSTNDEKLLIYRYQRNGSLQTMLGNYIQGKRNFPWKLRLSIAVGIARGLDFIHQRTDDGEIIPHGNIKLSNILLNEYEEPLISEYGYSKFFRPDQACICNSCGYTASENCLTEQADVFSYGVILLVLLTGKIVESSGVDLPKWVKSKVREEWTGEVFDSEVAKVGKYGFSLLNISLKCVSELPQDRPSISEVLEKIEEIVNAQGDFSSLSTISSESD